MREIDPQTARQYLIDTGRIAAHLPVRIERLAGGVSNEVLLVEIEPPTGPRYVLKQARPQLRTPQEWLCSVERIWREVAVMETCRRFTATGHVPEVLFEDRQNYLFAMTAAPAGHTVWRADLLAGRFDPEIAEQCGQLLGAIHAGSWRDPAIAGEFADRTIFRELRLDPYYQTVARVYPTERHLLDRLSQSVWEHPCALVHADYSPKNLLVYQGRIMLVDFETGHYGDPAFDLGFFLTHLVLKAIYHAPAAGPMLELCERFWTHYQAAVEDRIGDTAYSALEARGIQNLGGCLWSRIDGKSGVDYLTDDDRRNQVRTLARRLLIEQPRRWNEARALIDPFCSGS